MDKTKNLFSKKLLLSKKNEDEDVFNKNIKFNHRPSKSQKHINLHNQNLNSPNLMLAKRVLILPATFSLSSKYSLPVLDQGNLGSCVVTSFSGIIQSLRKVIPSRLYLYFMARIYTGLPYNEDTGLDLLQTIPVFQQYGSPLETIWPYNIQNFAKMPTPLTFKRGFNNQIIINANPVAQTPDAIKTALTANSFIMFGFIVYSSFVTNNVAQTGLVPMPQPSDKNLGGHCVHIVGWTVINNTTHYIIRNSWGKSWGNDGSTTYNSNFKNNGVNGGFCYMPEQYILSNNVFELISIS